MKTKEQELMDYLHANVFDPILNSKTCNLDIKRGVNITIVRMNKLSAEKMVHYFWSALATDNAIKFSKRMKDEGVTRFEDVMEEFRDRFNDSWLRK